LKVTRFSMVSARDAAHTPSPPRSGGEGGTHCEEMEG
jgi:hypothetical protein